MKTKTFFVLFSNDCLILELMLCNWNLTKFDILTLLSSYCRAEALKLSEPLKKQQKHVFVFILPPPSLPWFFCTFFLTLKKIISHLWSLLNLCDKYHFKKIVRIVIKLVKNQIFKKVYLLLKPTWRSCFFLFLSHDPKPKQNHQISSSRAKTRSTQSQVCVKYRGNIICIKRNTDVNTGDLRILHKKCLNKVDFPDVIFNISKIWCGLTSTLFLTGELWPLRFIWHHDLRVTHCQSSAMTFVFTQYSFCNSFRQGLITPWNFDTMFTTSCLSYCWRVCYQQGLPCLVCSLSERASTSTYESLYFPTNKWHGGVG